MLKRTLHKSFRSSARIPYSRHAHAILQSNVGSLLLLTTLLLYSNWCYQSLKKAVHADQAARQRRSGASFQAPVHANVSGFLFSWGLDANHRLGRGGGMTGDTGTPELTLAQLEVSAIAASRHSLLVTRSGTVWSMGANDSNGGGGHGSKALQASGQLGRTGSWAVGQVLGVLQGQVVKHVAAGRYHSVVVTAQGKVYTWGLNDWGQLGRAALATDDAAATSVAGQAAGAAPQQPILHRDERLPRRRQMLLGDNATAGDVAQAAAGLQLAQADSNKAVRVGAVAANMTAQAAAASSSSANAASTCHSGWSCHDGSPGLVTSLNNITVVAVKAGRYSTLVLDSAGQLWVWGYDSCATAGQLPQQDEAWKPRLVQGQLQGERVASFDVGYTFWLAATEGHGALYACDTRDDGYAGTLSTKRKPNNAGQLGRSGNPHEPGRVLGPLEHRSVVAVAAGREHALVATSDGMVYNFGGGRALGRQGSASGPALVTEALAGQHVRQVAAGEYFSLAATDSTVYAWGSNAYLCTGTGLKKDADVLQPTAVTGPLGSGAWTVYALAAGYQHALAIADQPGLQTAAALRQSALAAAMSAGGSSVQSSTIEVVLTEKQKQEREQFQKALQEKGAAAQPARHDDVQHAKKAELPQQPVSTDVAKPAASAQQQQEQPAAAAKLQAADSTSTEVAVGTVLMPHSAQPDDFQWSYLARQPKPGTLKAHEVWAAWKPSPWHDALAALSPDVFKLLPQQYNTMHKNPCWGSTGPQLACLPYFNIIGVSKCGTTDLYHRLTLYKQVILPATNKGPHFWDECPYPPKGPCQAGPSGDFQAYVNLFSRAADLIRSRPNSITGEASSNTFTSANGIYLRGFRGNTAVVSWAGAAGVNATMPALLREAQPYLRLILMMRNPVTRYYSAYHYYRWWLKEDKPPTPDDFHETALKEVQQWQDCVAASSVSDCVRRFRPQQLVKGMYADFLPDWLHHWPREQLLILRYEDYTAALPQHLKAVLTFLDVPEPDAATMQAMVSAEVQNKKPYPSMRADTKKLLEEFYAPFNAALAKLLDDERWRWQS